MPSLERRRNTSGNQSAVSVIEARPYLGMNFGIGLTLFALTGSLSLSACVAPASSLPGDSLGKYDVVATLGNNSCGSGIDATNPWDFSVEMSEDGSTLYLANEDGSDEVSSDSSVRSRKTSTTRARNLGTTCNMTLSTSFALTLGATSPPPRRRAAEAREALFDVVVGTPEGTRTPDRRVRNPLLYPAELRARVAWLTSNSSLQHRILFMRGAGVNRVWQFSATLRGWALASPPAPLNCGDPSDTRTELEARG